MMALTRKVGERLRIGDDVVITAFAVRDRKVHLKITVPESVTIWREESYQQLEGPSNNAEPTVEVCAWLGGPAPDNP
jgi:carbon storage regulator